MVSVAFNFNAVGFAEVVCNPHRIEPSIVTDMSKGGIGLVEFRQQGEFCRFASGRFSCAVDAVPFKVLLPTDGIDEVLSIVGPVNGHRLIAHVHRHIGNGRRSGEDVSIYLPIVVDIFTFVKVVVPVLVFTVECSLRPIGVNVEVSTPIVGVLAAAVPSCCDSGKDDVHRLSRRKLPFG